MAHCTPKMTVTDAYHRILRGEEIYAARSKNKGRQPAVLDSSTDDYVEKTINAASNAIKPVGRAASCVYGVLGSIDTELTIFGA